jgi:hypothetical protein
MGTSSDALDSIDVPALERLVLGIIKENPDGVISDEVREIALQRHGIVAYSSVTARFANLHRRGQISYDGRRPGRSGRGQRVMVAVV